MTRGGRALRSAMGTAVLALGVTGCANPPQRHFPDPPSPRASARPAAVAGAPVAARALTPLSADGIKTCLAWHDRLQTESANLEIMDRQVTAARRAIDAEEAKLTEERAAVDTRYLQQVKDYGRHVEDNRKRIQTWNTQVDAYNARVVAYNKDMRTFETGCASRMNRDYLRMQTAKGAGKTVPTATP